MAASCCGTELFELRIYIAAPGKMERERALTQVGVCVCLSACDVWVRGRFDGYCFTALVFAEQAENTTWEIGISCIS